MKTLSFKTRRKITEKNALRRREAALKWPPRFDKENKVVYLPLSTGVWGKNKPKYWFIIDKADFKRVYARSWKICKN